MSVDFNRIFGLSLRYPLKKDAYLVMLAVQLVFGIIGWFITGFFGRGLFGTGAIDAETMLVAENALAFFGYILPLTFAGWMVMAFLIPAFIDNSAHSFKGKDKAVGKSFGASFKRFLPTLAIFAVLGLILLACLGGLILLVLAVPVLFTPEGMALALAGGIWLLVGVVVGIIVVFTTFLSPVICTLENEKPLASIRKSWNLIKKNKANTLVFLIVFVIGYIGISLAGSAPEIIYTLLYGDPVGLGPADFSLMVIRTAVSTYLLLFALSSITGYYLGLAKKRLP